MDHITYQELVDRYGKKQADIYLYAFEHMARINKEIISIEKEDRFQKALEALNEINFAA